MHPYIKAPDGTLTILMVDDEFTIAPGHHQYDEILWAIERERWDLVPQMAAAHKAQEDYRPSSGPISRDQALRMLIDLLDSDDISTPDQKLAQIGYFNACSNEELQEELDLAGFFCEGPQEVVDDTTQVEPECILRTEAIVLVQEALNNLKKTLENILGDNEDLVSAVAPNLDAQTMTNEELQQALKDIGVNVERVIDEK